MVFLVVYVGYDVVAKVNHDQMLFVVHVDYVIIPEIHHMTIDDSFRSPRTLRRRRQRQSRPDDAIRSRREFRHFT